MIYCNKRLHGMKTNKEFPFRCKQKKVCEGIAAPILCTKTRLGNRKFVGSFNKLRKLLSRYVIKFWRQYKEYSSTLNQQVLEKTEFIL